MNNTRKELCYWAGIYNQLNARYKLNTEHQLSFSDFIQKPTQNLNAIRLYFANPQLFIYRKNGAAVQLVFFLSDPDGILLALLMGEQLRDEFEPDLHELLPKQSVAAAMIFWTDSTQDERIGWFGNCYMQRLHHHFPPHKWKTRSVHKKHKVAA